MGNNTKYHIAEMFTSPQGEGYWSGTIMRFIRLAGCSVGKPIKDWRGRAPGAMYEECKSVTGKSFICDTNFRKTEIRTAEEIATLIHPNIKHACITGGEPFNQNLVDLIEELWNIGMIVHIETSGTVYPDWFPALLNRSFTNMGTGNLWVTCSPKVGFLDQMVGVAAEIKLLVDEEFDVANVPEVIMKKPLIYLTPINYVFDFDKKSMTKAVEVALENPQLRVTCQLHKLLGVR